jgi:hypothetical protein
MGINHLIASFFLGVKSKGIREWDMGFGSPNCFLFFQGEIVRGLGSGIWDLEYLIASFSLGWK